MTEVAVGVLAVDGLLVICAAVGVLLKCRTKRRRQLAAIAADVAAFREQNGRPAVHPGEWTDIIPALVRRYVATRLTAGPGEPTSPIPGPAVAHSACAR